MTRWAALIATLLAASPAGAQCLGFQCPPGVLGAGASGGTALPLDGLTTPTGAYSFRKLRSAHAGPAVKLRRTTGGTQDIGFLGCTGFTGCPIDTAAAGTFCAATTCFIDTWYDQSGAARDLVQLTAANQPALVFNCVGSSPCLRTTAATQTLASVGTVTPATGVVSLSVVGQRSATAGCQWIRQNGATAPNRVVGNAGTWLIGGSTTFSSAAADSAWHAYVGALNGASTTVRVDSTNSAGSAAGSVNVGTVQLVGVAGGTCDQFETVIWDNIVLSAGEMVFLTGNQRAYLGLP